MLLRSSSTPILNSWLSHHNSKDTQHEPEQPVLILLRTKSANLSSASLHSSTLDPSNKPNPLKKTPIPPIKRRNQSKNRPKSIQHSKEVKPITHRLFSSSGLDEACDARKKESVLQTLEVGGVGNNGGKINGAGGGRKGSNGGDESSGFFSEGNNNNGIDNADANYQTMIKSDPSNPLFLGNYAKFLKEVRGEFGKAEEYCERAILANPSYADVLSTYADLIWNSHKDAQRAETYFDQVVKASPDDSYVLASYARFLWDAEEDEEDEENEMVRHETDQNQMNSSNFFQ